jgi:phosphomannomutase
MSKKKIQLTPGLDTGRLLDTMYEKYQSESISKVDGVKIDFSEGWVHMRKSNTEPIIRVYTEAATQEEADRLADRFLSELDAMSAQQA